MRPRIPNRLQQRASGWNHLSNRQRSDLGKELRRLGLMQSEIREIIPVAKSTLSYWCRDVQLTQKQVDKIRQRRYSTAGGRRDTQAKRREEIRVLRTEAQQQATEWSRDPLFAAGVALYWAEGSKTRNHFSIANTDPALLRVFIGWVRQYLDTSADFRLCLHLHEGNCEEAAKTYWRAELGLPTARFTKTYVKPRGTGHRKNRIPAGVCRVLVCRGGDHWQRTMQWIDNMSECMV